MTKCAICNKETTQKYCDNCKPIRAVYVIDKLLSKLSINEKFNNSTLMMKRISNVEVEDLNILIDYGLLKKDSYRNYTWTGEETVNEFMTGHGGKPIKKPKKTKAKKAKVVELTVSDALYIIEDSYNMGEDITFDSLKSNFKLSTNETKDVINKLLDEHLLKKTRKGNYLLNSISILKYKQRNKIKSTNKINAISHIKNEEVITTTKIEEHINDKTKVVKKIPQKKSKHVDLTAKIYDFIEKEMYILPKNISETDITSSRLYELFNDYLSKDYGAIIDEKRFNEELFNVISTNARIRYKKFDDLLRFNIKPRDTPLLVMKQLFESTEIFTKNDTRETKLIDNSLHLTGDVLIGEYCVLMSLVSFTHENIIEFNYSKADEFIKVNLVYDLTNENSDLWLDFINKFNW